MKTMFPEMRRGGEVVAQPLYTGQEKVEKELWRKAMLKGGFETAMVRVSLIVALADSSFDQRQFLAAHEIVRTNERLNHLKLSDLKRMVKEQAALVEYDIDKATATLAQLLPEREERAELYEIAENIAQADLQFNKKEKMQLEKIKAALGL